MSFAGPTPRISPPKIAARKQPVPVAENHMKGNLAPSVPALHLFDYLRATGRIVALQPVA